MAVYLYVLFICAAGTPVHTSGIQQYAESSNREMNQLSELVSQLIGKFSDLENSNKLLQEKVATLEASLKLQDVQHSKTKQIYKETIDELNKKIEAQQEWNTRTELKTVKLSEAMKQLEKGCGSLQSLISDANSKKKRQEEGQDAIAFYAGLSNVVNIGYGANIIFNNVSLNLGTHYIPSHGIFVAPVQGIYVFSTTLMTDLDTDTHAAIYVNEKLATWIKLYGSEHRYDTMSQTAVYQLNVGDAVAVKHTEKDKTFHGQYTYFSGFLLKQTYNSGIIIG